MVVAHRGASFAAPEHTLGAYVAAIESGADAVECDVRMTRDGHLVCVHDRTVNRTSDGRGVVSEFDLDDLNSLDFASWRHDLPGSADQLLNDSPYLAGVEPDRLESGRVLTLEVLLGLVRDASHDVRLLIETKHPTRYGGLVEKELVDMLMRFGWAGATPQQPSVRLKASLDNPVVVMSFTPLALRRVKLQAPQIPTVLLLDRLLPGRRDGMLPVGVPIAGPGLHVLRAEPEFVARAHARGHQVFVWTVDEPADVEFVLGLGVDTIITNRPAEVIAQLPPRS
ncbi:MAG TPA: glycerophosphodiester phosphodiesterase family protein [Jatrophihabitantaceae bacterium]|jgi:glycerophosphoryl diester phosphodiesterase|nr:glycerophosphodiester phosphodiesterase family protein [Jatrophihabitantaceae bacterium]